MVSGVSGSTEHWGRLLGPTPRRPLSYQPQTGLPATFHWFGTSEEVSYEAVKLSIFMVCMVVDVWVQLLEFWQSGHSAASSQKCHRDF